MGYLVYIMGYLVYIVGYGLLSVHYGLLSVHCPTGYLVYIVEGDYPASSRLKENVRVCVRVSLFYIYIYEYNPI